ncbi:uncharacterized protein V3H86_006565 [Mergus octosetaceus]
MASVPPRLEETLGKGLGRGHLGSTEGRAGPQQRTCRISQALERPKECPVATGVSAERDNGQARAAKGLWHQDGPCCAPGHFPKRTLSFSCYSVALQNMVKDFRGKTRPQALPPAVSVGGRRAHRADALQRGALGSPRQCPCPALEEAMELRVVLLLPLCFPGLQAQTHRELSQREGSNLSVLCHYPAEADYRELKSWCRWTDQGCQPQVAAIDTRTYTYTDWARQGYITIQGDPIRRIFSITMTDLRVEDSGMYYCAYRKGWESYVPLKWISLTVFKEFHKLELDSLSVQCPYHALGYRSERKAWCRSVGQTGRCELVVSTDSTYTLGISKAQKGRASIQDDPQKRTITVTMEKLQAQDSGVYWCALYRPYATINFTRIMEVRLSVAKRPAATTLSVTTGINQNYPPGNSTLAGLWSFTLWALLGFFINKVLVILLLVFLQRRGRCRKEKCRAAEALERPKECPVATGMSAERDNGQARAAKGLWRQDGPCCAPGHFPKRTLSFSCYSVALQNMVKDFRGKTRPQALPPAVSVGGRRAHRADALQRGALGSPRQCPCPALEEAMELRVVLLLPLCFPGLQAQTHRELSQREGSNLSVLCHYPAEADYRELKSWCRWTDQGCQPQVAAIDTRTYTYTDWARQGYITIQGDPIRRIFSITMTDLRVEDSGMYYCAYRKGWESYVPLKWISLTVFKEFHKLELDSLSVQCPYHALGYRSERKAWCRSVGQTGRCELVVSTDSTYTLGISKAQKGRASIQDDTRKRTVTITMEKLQAQDSGVYWCALYRPYATINFTRIIEVRLSVSKRPAVTTLSSTTGTNQNYPPGNSTLAGQGVSTYIIISAVLYLLLIPVVIILITLCIRHHRKLKRRGNRQAEDIYDKPEDTTQLESTERMETPKDDSKDLKYVTLDFKSQRHPEEPLYCNVEPDQASKNPKDENVEYAIIARS